MWSRFEEAEQSQTQFTSEACIGVSGIPILAEHRPIAPSSTSRAGQLSSERAWVERLHVVDRRTPTPVDIVARVFVARLRPRERQRALTRAIDEPDHTIRAALSVSESNQAKLATIPTTDCEYGGLIT